MAKNPPEYPEEPELVLTGQVPVGSMDSKCPECGLPAEVPGEGRFCGSCQDYEGTCRNDHCMTCGALT